MGARVQYSAEFQRWQHFAMKAQARTQRHASPARQQTHSEIGKWAVDDTKGSMKGAHRYLQKLGQQALAETCLEAAGQE
eukprot:8233641-Pyramimonas_sp.AAC.1